MYNCEIRKVTTLCAFFEISLKPFEINYVTLVNGYGKNLLNKAYHLLVILLKG